MKTSKQQKGVIEALDYLLEVKMIGPEAHNFGIEMSALIDKSMNCDTHRGTDIANEMVALQAEITGCFNLLHHGITSSKELEVIVKAELEEMKDAAAEDGRYLADLEEWDHSSKGKLH